MIHWRVAFSLDVWYHIIASSDVDSIKERPNGIASIFMQSHDAPRSGQSHFIVSGADVRNGLPGEIIAMEKAIDYLEKNVVKKTKTNVVKF